MISQEIEIIPPDSITQFHEVVVITSRNEVTVHFTWQPIREIIGIAVINTRGIAKGKKTVIIGH